MDSQLAHLRGLLEKKYANDHDSGYTYIDPVTSDLVPLTPFMMTEWSRAMVQSIYCEYHFTSDILLQYDGLATVNQPPSTVTFDRVNRRSSLHAHHPHSLLASSPAPYSVQGVSGNDLAHIISSVVSSIVTVHTPLKPSSTPPCPAPVVTTHLPTQHTPSKLLRFLEYAELHLNIKNAHLHEESLWILGFGPDILHLVDDNALTNIGLTLGDVIHLKQNSQQWWNSADAKHKWTQADQPPSIPTTPPNKRVAFEKRYHNGGCYRVYGPKMVKVDNFSPKPGADWFYFCKASDTFIPLPPSYAPVLDSKEEHELR